MRLTNLVTASSLLISAASISAASPADHVVPFIGTTNFGATNPGAVLPNGLMSVSPFNVTGSDTNRYDKDARWWSTPYEYTNSFFTGFSHVNLSGVGCPEAGSILTIATSGDLEPDYRKYGRAYTDETAHPGYYALTLPDYGIRAEATATERTSRERFTFTAGGTGNVLVNLGQALSNESGASVNRVSDTEIEGSKLLGTFCYNPGAVFPIYFVARVNRVPSSAGYWKMQPEMTGVEAEWTPDNGKYKIYTDYGRELSGDDIGYWFTFDGLQPGESVELSIGVSFTSIENARANLNAEQPSKADFASLSKAATSRWNEDLGKIAVDGGTDDQLKVFYTALYHSLIHPSVISDVNGDYPMMENPGTGNSKSPRYTVFSLWDTYRNLHQLLTLVYPDRQTDMLRTMTAMYDEWGWLPKWELFGRETFTMEGDPATCVIVDSWRKGLKKFDIDKAYKAMVKSATTPGESNAMRPDIDPYAARGYIPVGHYAGDLSGDNSVSHALEYYVADAALAWLARERGDIELADSLSRRSLGYRHYYSPEYGTLRPINADGTFVSPFNPRGGENFSNAVGFHEGSAWNYSFAVPHDVEGLIALNGGPAAFTAKLQKVFDEGLYDPANEPDIAYPYLFSRIPGEEWRTQREVARLLREHYTTRPDGIPGNDDCGTMSAWAVFSMLGLYPDAPGEPFYTLTSPTFDHAKVTLPSGSLTVTAERDAPGAIYISEVTLDGKPLDSLRIAHSAITSKGHHKLHYKLVSRPIDHVDPLIGTGDHGHVFVGANVPFGMVQLGPTSFPETWDWCSGYHQSDSTVIGFSHTHLSGTGIGDLFDVTIRPVTSRPAGYTRSDAVDMALRHDEVARPGFYSVPLSSGILAEMTASTRVGLSRYTFPDTVSQQRLVIDLANGGCWDKVTESGLEAKPDGTLTGWRRSSGWAKDQKVYFAIQFSRGGFSHEKVSDHHYLVSFPGNDAPLMVKVGISPVSVDGAVANLSEIPDWNFSRVRAEATAAWEKELGKVKVEGGTPEDMRTFYTALYHTHFFPATFSDVNSDRPAYTIYSLWDTYRAEMPLLSILQPERYPQMINSMLDIFDRQGRLPVWHLWGNETDCMVGNPGIIPVADAVVKKIPGVDPERALNAMLVTAADTARGGGLRQRHGFIPCDSFPEAIAFDMEYAIADGAIARAAEAIGNYAGVARVIPYFTQRSRSWRKYFDRSTGFVRGKMADGSWRTPFDPNFAQHRANDYCEGNAWQYTWLAPQDVDGLVESFGSREATLAALDSLFVAPMIVTGDDASPDISGLIGQYAHGNEPVHHVIYLYSILGEPDKAADRVRQTLAELYTDKPAGLSGNEDAGQMSAWYVLSSLGFYQPEPASGRYWFGYPKWSRATIEVPGGQMVLEKQGEGHHIASVSLNGKKLDRHYITHEELIAGGNIVFHMKE